DRLWNLAKDFIPSYADYERLAAGRTIPVLVFSECA
ncbi:nitroreductase family deazaflavin-dependent oxidoreductase, partial [Mycobacterium sp. ITM-2017-0098]